MNIRDALIAGDPVRREGPLADADVQVMRARTLANDGHAARPRLLSGWAVALSAYCVVALVLVMFVARQPHQPTAAAATERETRDGAVSRVYFETTSGIRVVWTFDAGFSERQLP